jgi:DNA transposition AAA+ family ATPase
MEQIDKNKIRQLFEEKRARLNFSVSQAATAAGTKSSTLSAVFSGKYGANDEGIYKLLALWVDYDINWNMVETAPLRFIHKFNQDAKENSFMYLIIGSAGAGKTGAQRYFAQHNPNSFLIRCDAYWTTQQFLQEIMVQIGRDPGGMNVAQLISMITRVLLQLDKPVLFFDEVDKLSNQCFQLFISLYNRLEDRCGIVLTGAHYMFNRMDKGVKRNSKGYAEIWSRLGRKAIYCPAMKLNDCTAICTANGVQDEHQIKVIFEESDGDIRRVKKSIHAYKKMIEKNAA